MDHNEFVELVEKRAEEKMLKTGKLEGSHYAAMKEIQKELDASDKTDKVADLCGKAQDPIIEKLEKEFAEVINRNSLENWTNTPDFILARYLIDCLRLFADTSKSREQWYGKELKI